MGRRNKVTNYYLKNQPTEAVKLSTLRKFSSQVIELPELQNDEQDCYVNITSTEKRNIDLELQQTASNCCSSCNKSFYVSQDSCSCRKKIPDIDWIAWKQKTQTESKGWTFETTNNIDFERERRNLLEEIEETEKTLALFKETPFRETRNAYQVGISVFSIENFLFGVVGLVNPYFLLLSVIPVFSYMYNHAGAKKQEQTAYAKLESKLFEQKTLLLEKHAKAVTARQENTPKIYSETKQGLSVAESKLIQPEARTRINLKNAPSYRINSFDEIRHPVRNSLAHGFFSASTSFLMLSAMIKYALLCTLVAAGGPATWTVAALLSIGIGLYFCWKRYKNLSYKIKLETQMTRLAERGKQLDVISDTFVVPKLQA